MANFKWHFEVSQCWTPLPSLACRGLSAYPTLSSHAHASGFHPSSLSHIYNSSLPRTPSCRMMTTPSVFLAHTSFLSSGAPYLSAYAYPRISPPALCLHALQTPVRLHTLCTYVSRPLHMLKLLPWKLFSPGSFFFQIANSHLYFKS